MRVNLYQKIIGCLLFCFCYASTCLAADPYYEFDIPWHNWESSLLDMSSRVLDSPAGKHGRVVAREDKIFFEDGTPVKFWGVGLTFSGSLPTKFPPDKKTAKALIGKLAQNGFNHVRFVGLDNTATEPYRAWLKNGDVSSPTMDSLDYFIAELRKAGIYYSFSINNNAVAILDNVQGLQQNDAAQNRLRRYRYVRLYDERAIDAVSKWIGAFYAHVNKYTGYSIAQDPANVYVSAVNEDSIFEAYFNDFKHLGEENRRMLATKFNSYLKGLYGDTVRLQLSWNRGGKNGLDSHERLESSSVRLLMRDELASYGDQRRRDTMRFLVGIDSAFADRVKETLENVGYKGLFTGTNNWYGYGNLLANSRVGNYVEMHGYFDHPKRIKQPISADAVSNRSYLSMPMEKQGREQNLADDYAFPFSRTFASALVDRPMVISEWNHGIWGDYAYEGPLLMTAYASFQGYPILDLHTYFNHPNPDPKDTVARETLVVSANPVIMVLEPTLSLAFIKGYIREPITPMVVTIGKNEDEVLDYVSKVALGKSSKLPLEAGFIHKLRTKLIGQEKTAWKPPSGKYYKTDTGEIIWDQRNPAGGVLSINTSKFKAVAGAPLAFQAEDGEFGVSLKEHGVVTAIALDDLPLRVSKNILITAVQSFHNSNMKTIDTPWQRAVIDPGKGPVSLRRVDGKVFVETENMSAPSLSYIKPDGSIVPSASNVKSFIEKGERRLEITLGADSSPWYLLQVN